MTFAGSVRQRYGPCHDADLAFRREIVHAAETFICQREKEIDGVFLYPCMIAFIEQKLVLLGQKLETQKIEERERVPDLRPHHEGKQIHVGISQHVAFIFETLVYEWKVMEPLTRAFPNREKRIQECHVILEDLKCWCDSQLSRFVSGRRLSSHYQ